MRRSYTMTARKVDKKTVGMETKKRRTRTFVVYIVPKVSVLSFGNDTIRNTVPTLFQYIGNDDDKTITIQ